MPVCLLACMHISISEWMPMYISCGKIGIWRIERPCSLLKVVFSHFDQVTWFGLKLLLNHVDFLTIWFPTDLYFYFCWTCCSTNTFLFCKCRMEIQMIGWLLNSVSMLQKIHCAYQRYFPSSPCLLCDNDFELVNIWSGQLVPDV